MFIFGELERFVAEDLYPYRWLISIALMAVAAVVAYVAYRREWHLVLWRHKLASAVAAAVLIAISIPAGDYFLSPLWERSFLEEEESPIALASGPQDPVAAGTSTTEPAPGATEGPDATQRGAEAPFAARITHQGEISGADSFHSGRGTAQLIETAQGQYTLRFEEFSVRNGPDLFVYLTPDENSVDGALNLGGLKATDGAFNYEVPAGTDVSRYKYAIVWCRQFAVLFASAPLDSAG